MDPRSADKSRLRERMDDAVHEAEELVAQELRLQETGFDDGDCAELAGLFDDEDARLEAELAA